MKDWRAESGRPTRSPLSWVRERIHERARRERRSRNNMACILMEAALRLPGPGIGD